MYKIFISYSWDSRTHKEWVKKLADDLEEYQEFHIILDEYDLNNQIDKNYFMEKGIFESNLVLVICTEEYALKANNRDGGVGIETFMNTIKHWEEMAEKKESNIFTIVRERRNSSIPNYLKGKISISFQNDSEYDKSLNYLIEKIRVHMTKDNNRPPKTKTLRDKPINYFQFDRVDDILAIIAKRREKIDSEIDFSGKNRIKYEYWKISSLNADLLILVLFNHITIKDTLERFIDKNHKNLPKNLTILRTTHGEKDYINKIFENKNKNIYIKEYTIEQFIWDECIDQEWKNENKITEEEFFIDQRVYEEDVLGNKNNLDLSLPYITNNFIESNIDKSTLILFASGGMGKSTLSQVLTNKINDSKVKKALLIQSDIIRNNIQKDAIRNFEIKNLYELYDIYEKMIIKNKSLLTQKQFELGIISGKIVIIIDGLDEIITLFKENFNLKEFINSLEVLNNQLGKAKVIITSRVNILENNNYLKTIQDIKILYLKGFEEDIWNKYINKRFSKYRNTDAYVKKINKHISWLLEISKEKEKIILPFFVNLISEIAEEEIKIEGDKNELIIDSIDNDYKCNNESIDYLIHALLKREIKRQKFDINISKFITFFKELTISYGDKFSFENLKEFIEIYFDSNDINEIYEKILLNPLIKSNKIEGIVCFKYDFLTNYFKSLALIDYLSQDEIKVLDKNVINELSKFYDGSHIILKELVKYFSKNIKQCIYNSKKIISLIVIEIQKSSTNNIKLKHTISSLLYLTQKIYGEELSRDKRIEIIKELYNNNEIKHLYIWRDFYALDFSNIKIWFSEFHEYNALSKCKFDNMTFYHSLFYNTQILDKCDLTKANFELESCTLGDIQKYIDENDLNNKGQVKNIEEDFTIFCRNFFNGLNFEAKLIENITIPPKFQSKKKNLLDFLLEKDFLRRSSINKYYEIDKKYQRSVKNLINNNHIDTDLKLIFKSYLNK